MAFTRKQAIRYFVMPEFKPRIKEIFISGFQYIPFFMALVYQLVRLLPQNHPYTRAENLGKFGIRHVVAEAANHLVISRNNIDQILVFGLVLVGIVLAASQVALFGISIFSGTVFAQTMPTTFAGFFVTPDPTHDLAHMLMDLVFGIPEFFLSCVDTTVSVNCHDLSEEEVTKSIDTGGGWILDNLGWPHPIHHAMHQMFQWYSYGLLVVAAMIALYFVVTVIVETAQEGTPFGKRFNKVWAPIRIVVAFGLLIPVTHGLNSSQYIVLYAAKFGSGFATNGWNLFNDVLGTDTVTLGDGTKEQLVSKPALPNLGGLYQFLWTSRVCAEAYKMPHAIDQSNPNAPPPPDAKEIYPYLVRDSQTAQPSVKVDDPWGGNDIGYDIMLDYAEGGGQVTLRFGEYSQTKYPDAKGYVEPLCGEIIIPISDPRDPNSADNPPEPGAYRMQYMYWDAVKQIWWNWMNDDWYGNPIAENVVRTYGPDQKSNLVLPNAEYVSSIDREYRHDFNVEIDFTIEDQFNSGSWSNEKLKKRGWGGAGIWYNTVSEVNGILTSAVMNSPIVSKYPDIMEHIMLKKIKQDGHVSVETRYKPDISGNDDVNMLEEADLELAEIMWNAFYLWQKAGHGKTPHTAPTGLVLMDVINEFFGTSGLYRLADNEGTHPLAMLVGMGRSLVEAALKNLGFSIASATAGGLLSSLDGLPIAGEGAQAASTAIGFLMTFVMIGLTIGFVLYYVIPFMPFVYFFFAFSGWVKGIFEAMVGAPLWALAHIRIDGEGLPGSAALNGYLLIFEIFLRPILIVFGMLASITTFSALVDVLNMVWELVVQNISGFDNETQAASGTLSAFFRGPLDEFFYTVVYAIVVYLLAMASFKMIDLVPNTILRWMGQTVQSFGDQNENPTGNLMRIAGVGGQQTIDALGGGVSGALQKLATIGAKKVG